MICLSLLVLLSCWSTVIANAIVPAKFPYPRNESNPGAYAEGIRAVAYFGNWDIYAREFLVTDIPANELSHLIYAFANVNVTTGEVYMSDDWADLQYPYAGDNTSASGTNVYGGVKQLFLLKKANRSLKTMLSIGGYTYSPNFVTTLASESMRLTFAQTAVSLLSNLGFDGLDIDYEYVTNSTQAAELVDLLKKTRYLMDEYARNISAAPFILSFASPAGPDNYKKLDFEGMDQYLDFWNFLGFDYTGPWSNYSGHMSNLFQDYSNELSTPFNSSSGIDYYNQQGKVALSKINLGSPLYGRTFNETAGPGTPYNGTGDAGSFGDAGIWDYKALPLPGYNASVVNIKAIGASYSYDAEQEYMISYDTPAIAAVKAEYILSKRVGGSMWWEVSMDKPGNESLISTTIKSFGGVSKLDKSLNHLSYPYSMYDNLRNGFPDN